MGTSKNWLGARDHVLETLIADGKALAERVLEEAKRRGEHPEAWEKRAVECAKGSPGAAATYLKIRSALWNWKEFASLRRGSRAILEVVIELAREEVFPWWVAVPAEDVRRLARLSEAKYAECARDLELLVISRPARMMKVSDEDGLARFPGVVDASEPMREIAQFVVRYARGIPWNRKRAAWWINYNLLCETGKALQWFAMEVDQLPKTYGSRNGRMGPRKVCLGQPSDPAILRMFERKVSMSGPMPALGMRAALWEAGEGAGVRG